MIYKLSIEKRYEIMPKSQIEEDIAKAVLDLFPIITDGDTGISYISTSNVYIPITQNRLDYFIISEYQEQEEKYSRNKKNISIDFFKTLSYLPTHIIEESTAGTINLRNGVYFLDRTVPVFVVNNETHEGYNEERHFKAHPINNYWSYSQIPVDYDPEAKCPNIDQFLIDIFGDDKINDIYDFIGYLLLPHVKYQRAMMLVGTGANGKTTFLDLIIHFLGKENISNISLQELDDRFSLINTKHKYGNIVSDIPLKDLNDTGNAKRLATDETLSGSIKNIQGNFVFTNRCKMLYSSNKLPRSKDKSNAFYRRWLLYLCMSDFKHNPDLFILEKLITPEELSGLFNRALEGITRLTINNGFPDTTDEVRAIWEMETNPIADFLSNRCSKITKGVIKSKDLFEAFNIYRASKGLELFDGRKIGYWLRQYGVVGKQRPDTDDVDKYGNPKWYTFYQGYTLKVPIEIQQELDLWDMADD